MAVAYANYLCSTTLHRAIREDTGFANQLAHRAMQFIEDVTGARWGHRF